MTRVFVAGATGVLGTRLVDRLTNRGHEVYGLTRDEAGAAAVETNGGVPVRGDVLDPDSLHEAVGDRELDVVVHAATKLPAKAKTSAEYWQENGRVRRQGARNLVAVLGDRTDRFCFPSVVMVARQPDGSAFDEDSERHPDRTTQSAADVEDYLWQAEDEHGFEATILRTGFYYGPDSAHSRLFAENLLAGEFPIIGGGLLGRQDAELSLLHVDDAASAFADAIDAEVTGLYHVVDDEPVTAAEFLRTFADLLDAPEPSRIPWWLAWPLAGTDNVRFMTSPFPTSNDRFRGATGWEPAYPTYREGLRQVVETWERDGTLAELRGDGAAEEPVAAAGGSV
jgi:nucleoside-diphosphate-sugar epimerase